MRLLPTLAFALFAGCARPPEHGLPTTVADVGVRVRQAELALAENRPKAAIRRCRLAAQAAALPLNGRLILAAAYRADGKGDSAESELQACERDFPSAAGPPRALALLSASSGRLDEAIRHYRRVLELAPADGGAQRAIAQLQARSGQHHAAVDTLRARLRQAPDDLAASFLVAASLRAAGDDSGALAALRAATTRSPNSAVAHTELGAHYQQLDRLDEACKEFERALELDRRFVPAMNNLALVLGQRGDDQRAERVARLAVALAPTNGHCLDTLGWILLRRGAPAEAAGALEIASRRVPDSPTIAYHLGAAYAKLGAKADARALLAGALASSRQFSESKECRRVLAQLGKSPS